MHIYAAYAPDRSPVLHGGDCRDLLRAMPDESVDLTITSPPYCMGKEYERSQQMDDFEKLQQEIFPQVARVTKSGGSICWQIGYYVKKNEVLPLDFIVYMIAQSIPELKLRNRIIWTFGHGEHSLRRFSGRHEVILWFTKGDDYWFDLESVRVPQKYPGKKHYKGPRRGTFSGNPRGKNPSNVWDIPNVKAAHVEKTSHPCQFPVALALRLTQALTPRGATVLDPFLGSGTTGAAAILMGRRFVGAEMNGEYLRIARDRMSQAYDGTLAYRPLERPLRIPDPREAVAQPPSHFGSRGAE